MFDVLLLYSQRNSQVVVIMKLKGYLPLTKASLKSKLLNPNFIILYVYFLCRFSDLHHIIRFKSQLRIWKENLALRNYLYFKHRLLDNIHYLK